MNVKCEGIENELLQHVSGPYFFLDCSFPMIQKLARAGNKNVAVRFSEYEGLELLRNMAGLVDWVWVDTFHGTHHKVEDFREMKRLGYKICIVSPELQNLTNLSIENYAKYLSDNSIEIDAICTKSWSIPKWKAHLKIHDSS